VAGIFERLALIDGGQLAARVSMLAATRALQQLLRSGFDPADALPRQLLDVAHGQLLLMPAEAGAWAGQKFATVAPGNPARGLERIQGIYILLDGETLSPTALLDGTELTSIRTPAVSAAVVDLLAEPDAAELVIFGTGPQGIRHAEAMAAIRPSIARVTLVGRDAAKAEHAATAVRAMGLDARVGSPDDVRHADIVIAATTAREPLFDDALVGDHVAIAAVGSHEPGARELPGSLIGRSQVVVETDAVARAEAGDVIMAVGEGRIAFEQLVPMRDIVAGAVPVDRSRPRVVKTCGMGWQDLCVAALAVAPSVKER
jgi:ornithine cyclodeaminase